MAKQHFLLNKETPRLLEESGSGRASRKAGPRTDWRHAAGLALAALGVILIAVGWFQLSGTSKTNEQLSYFLSGGVGGAAILACGLALLISREHVSDRETMESVVERLDRLETDLLAELQILRADLGVRRGQNGVGN